MPARRTSSPPEIRYTDDPIPKAASLNEYGIEDAFLQKLQALKYEYRPNITNRATLEANFREKFEALNRCRLTGSAVRRFTMPELDFAV